jgi:hypothetical protein
MEKQPAGNGKEGKTGSPGEASAKAGKAAYRTVRYFKYAFGEIVLVVIGILIAIQINAFYKNKSEEGTNIQLLNRLISEIELNIERLDFLEYNYALDSLNTEYFAKNEETLKRGLAILERGITSSNIDSLINTDFNKSSYNLHRSIYDEMINTGKLYSIGSKELISQINEYYKQIEKEEYYNKQNVANTNDLYLDCKYGWVNFEIEYELDSDLNIEDYIWLFDKTSPEFINLRTYFAYAYSIIKRSRQRVGGIRKASKQLIEHINERIND